MRFMMIMIPNLAEEDWPADAAAITRTEEFVKMDKYNDELTKAGEPCKGTPGPDGLCAAHKPRGDGDPPPPGPVVTDQ